MSRIRAASLHRRRFDGTVLSVPAPGLLYRRICRLRQDYANSVLIDKTAVQDLNLSNPILNVMGMLPNSRISASDPASPAHYLLILGYDYQPCFSPESLGQ